MRCGYVQCTLLLVCLASAAAATTWDGKVALGAAGALEFQVTFTDTDSAQTATLTIPAQALYDAVLQEVVYTDHQLAFELRIPGAPEQATAQFRAERQGNEATGQLHQHGRTFPLTLTRLKSAPPPPARPQEPKPPFDYDVEPVTFAAPGDSAVIAGSLVLPRQPPRPPVAILVSGSGPQDRDSTIFGHRPFWVLADYLARQGIASLRYDDRGVGDSELGDTGVTTHTLAEDLVAAAAVVRAHPRLDQERIGVIGHSEGGLIAGLAAPAADITFVVLLGTPGVRGDSLLVMQNRALLSASGVAHSSQAAILSAHAELLRVARQGGEVDALHAAARVLVTEQLTRLGAGEPSADVVEASARGAAQQLATPWMQAFLNLDPHPIFAAVEAPVLALTGSVDRQVPSPANPEALRAALAFNPEATVEVVDGANHLLQPATTGLPAEYAQIEETIDSRVLERIGQWINALQ